MSHCKYHPLKPASYYCRNCKLFTCESCCDENPASDDIEARRCFNCGQPLTFLGAAYSVEPFWRKLDQIYRYGFNKQSLMLIGLVTVIAFLAQYYQVTLLLLVPAIFLMRYSFQCLENTAAGKMEAPKVEESFNGGIQLLAQVIAIGGLGIALVIVVESFLGEELAIVMLCLVLIVLPANFILLAVNGDLAEAVSPSNIVQLIKSTGAAYIIMLVFLFIMSSSLVLLSSLIGAEHKNIQIITSNLITGYYSVITFHMMGYLVFQKQDALGFYAPDSSVSHEPRTELQIKTAQIEVLVKEGRYALAIEVYRELLPKNHNNLSLWEKCFKLICAVKDKEALERYSDTYLPRIMSRGDEYATVNTYRAISAVIPNYHPSKADVCNDLARDLFNQGDYKSVIKLLNNFHKRYNNKPAIFEAYTLLKSALLKTPNLAHKADSYQKFLDKLKATIDSDREKELKDNPLAKFM